MSTVETAAPVSTPTTGSTRARGAELRPLWEPIVFAVVLSAAYLASDSSAQFVLTTGVIYALLATSLSVLLGWSGIYSFGHAAFFGAGAYTAGLMAERELSPLVFLLAGAACAGVLAFAVGLLGSRVVAVQFAMLTLIVGQVAYLLTFKIDRLEGDNGIFGIPLDTVFGVDLLDGDNTWWYVLVVVAIALGVLRRLQLSPWGAALTAVRDDPVKAAALGLPVRALRLSAFTLAGMVAGLAGVLFAQQQGIVTPSTLTFTFSGQIIIMTLLGGLRHFWGAAIGAVVFVWLNDQVLGSTQNAALVLGLILLVIVVALPGGLLGLVDRSRALIGRLTSRRQR